MSDRGFKIMRAILGAALGFGVGFTLALIYRVLEAIYGGG